MPRRIAFLRAINVGGHVVKMDHLRKLLTSFGLENVETVIASGNVVFDDEVDIDSRRSRTRSRPVCSPSWATKS